MYVLQRVLNTLSLSLSRTFTNSGLVRIASGPAQESPCHDGLASCMRSEVATGRTNKVASRCATATWQSPCVKKYHMPAWRPKEKILSLPSWQSPAGRKNRVMLAVEDVKLQGQEIIVPYLQA